MSDVLLHPIPRFVVSRFVPLHPISCYPGLVGVVHRVRGRLVSPPEVGDRRWPVWCEHGFMQWGWPWKIGFVFTRVTFISPMTSVTRPRYPTSHCSAKWSERAERALIQY